MTKENMKDLQKNLEESLQESNRLREQLAKAEKEHRATIEEWVMDLFYNMRGATGVKLPRRVLVVVLLAHISVCHGLWPAQLELHLSKLLWKKNLLNERPIWKTQTAEKSLSGSIVQMEIVFVHHVIFSCRVNLSRIHKVGSILHCMCLTAVL